MDTLWEELTTKLLKDFPIGRTLSIDSILYLIGLQEVGKLHDTFSRDDKINLIHVGTCKVFYTGIAGVFDGKTLDTCVLIRFIEHIGEKFYYKSGAGITVQSKPESEYKEILEKIYIPN